MIKFLKISNDILPHETFIKLSEHEFHYSVSSLHVRVCGSLKKEAGARKGILRIQSVNKSTNLFII